MIYLHEWQHTWRPGSICCINPWTGKDAWRNCCRGPTISLTTHLSSYFALKGLVKSKNEPSVMEENKCTYSWGGNYPDMNSGLQRISEYLEITPHSPTYISAHTQTQQKLKLGNSFCMKYEKKHLEKHPQSVDKLAICSVLKPFTKWRSKISL